MRNMALRGLSIGKRIDASDNWLRFPFYHHVFDDERAGFERQLRFLRQFGDFISMDDAVDILESGTAIDGRFFCLTFDDGFKSCMTGALPILTEIGAPATFYVVTSLIGMILPPDDPIARNVFGFKGDQTGLDFLSWADCRILVDAGMTIGSHTRSHPRLANLTEAEIISEMNLSKEDIENQIGQPCLHFCTPYGLAGSDFNLERDPELARLAGYRSFVTGHRGSMRQGSNPFAIQRDQLMANWGNHQLRYFFTEK